MAKLSAGSTVGGQQIETTAGAQAKANAVQTNLTNHINNKNNPHGVTKSQVGLGNVDNVKQASKSEFDAHVNNKNNPHNVTSEQISRTTEKSADVPGTSYPKGYSYFSTANGRSLGYPANLAVVQTIHDTEHRITQYVTDNSSSTSMGKWYRIYRSDTGWSGFTQIETTIGAQAKVNSHANRTDNPHNVTKSQVGLGNVQNYGVASQSQAEEGTASNAYMTPLRTKQAIDALSPVKSVAGKKGAVTLSKSDVGLGNVDNVKQASKTEFDAHVNNKSNPHGVTKSQVGLGSVQNYGIATQAEAEAGTVNNKYMTPLRVHEAILALSKIKYIGAITADTRFENYDNGIYFGHPEGSEFPKSGTNHAMIIIVHNASSLFSIAKGLIITSNNIYVANYAYSHGWSVWTELVQDKV